ncbi:hypothetical protein BE04_26220 [Sorangium cellulosum]|uniref:Uncharacterized protein n=2 Tax=Sorangium cellulosum TaxID=56 RepID=A0A150PQZ8_SORCE|nr:hypothetical protein SCE1572_10890 [Sorangium cellulosum So0157-2]KYF58104.1 hypothetical protein BE04_26220 [Sorangium cellulosum]
MDSQRSGRRAATPHLARLATRRLGTPGSRQAAAEADDALESLLLLLVDEELLDPESELVPEDPEELPEPLSDFAGGLFEPEAYRSEYQPPPLRMKPVPREICRRAVALWHDGHSESGASLMDCSASHSCAQDVQAYSYVGMAFLLLGTTRGIWLR